MARHSWLGIAVALLVLMPWRPGHAQEPELRVAVYAPWAGPATADERFAFALRLEAALTKAELAPAKVSSYAKHKDFQRAVRSGKVDVALVDASAAAAMPTRLAVVASWSSGDPWVLAGSSRLTSLRNKRLALQAPDAKSSTRLIARLLREQVSAGYWSRVVGAPVTDDARQLVLRDRADVVAVPARLAEGMTVLIDLGPFSELALATSGNSKRMSRAADTLRAVVRDSLGGRWTDGAPRFPAAVGRTQLLAAPVTATGPKIFDLLAPVAVSAPDLSLDEMWMEPNAP